MRWVVKVADILAEDADVLICSANVYLNLSGGVGGEILGRYGEDMQRELRCYLRGNDIQHVERGDVVATRSCGTNFGTVLHAVAVDAVYDTTQDVVSRVVNDSLERAAALRARRVALVALATGYGPLSMAEFGIVLSDLAHKRYPPIQRVTICVGKNDDANDLLASFAIAHSD